MALEGRQGCVSERDCLSCHTSHRYLEIRHTQASGFPREIDQAIGCASGSAVPERGLSRSSRQYRNREPARAPGNVSLMDRLLLFISIALASTLLLFAFGVFPYSLGLIVLTLLALGRFLQIKGQA